MTGYVLARNFGGLLAPRRRATLDNTVVFWHYTALQGIAIVAIVQWLPRLMN